MGFRAACSRHPIAGTLKCHITYMNARFLDIYFVIFKSFQPSVCKLKPGAAASWSECLHFGICSNHRSILQTAEDLFPFSSVAVVLWFVNPLNLELNPICYLLALLAHHFLHVSRIRVKSLTLRLLMSYVYGAPILDVSRSYTTTQHSR